MFKKDYLQIAPDGILFHVKVVPNSSAFLIAGFDPWLNAVKVKVKSPAMNGAANQELAEELSKILKTKIEIVHGEKSSQKILLAKNLTMNAFQLRLPIKT